MEQINDTLTLKQLLRELREKGILLHLDGDGSLSIEAPKGALLPSLLSEIRAHREELTAHLAGLEQAAAKEIPLAPASASYPLSSSQLRMWLAHEMQGDAKQFNISSVIDLEGEWDPQLLHAAVVQAVQRHEVLRTAFHRDGSGEVRQWVLPASDLNELVSYRDLSSNVDQYAKMHAAIAIDANRPFDLDHFPLFRICLYRIGKGAYFLHYVLHHIISDGWSMNVMAKDVLGYYGAQTGEQSYRPAPLRIQYKDYATWQRAQLKTPAFEAHRQYWKERLKDNTQRMELFAGKARPGVFSGRGHALKTRVQGSEVTALRELSVRAGGSLFMGLLALVRTLLYRYSGQDSLVIGTPIAGRQQGDLHDQIGLYINTLPLRTTVRKDDSFESLLDRTRNDVMEAYQHQDYPFDEILRDVGGAADRSRNALFDVMMGLQNFNENTGTERYADRGSDEITDLGPVDTAFDLLFDFHEVQDQLELRLQYNVAVYEGWQMEGLLRHLRTLLRSCLQSPALSLSQHRYLDTEGFARLQALSAPAPEPYDTHATVLSLFAHQVALQPQATALWSSEGELSYQELDEQSTRLAHELKRQGITSGSLVPVCLERNASLISSLLGILKSGAAYLPLDPQTPKERLAYLLEDSAATIVLTDTYYEELFSGLPARRLCLDRDTFADTNSDDNLPIAAPHDLAYVIYTSGSTGQPKGVMIAHTSIVNLMGWHGGRYNVNPQSRSTCMAGVAFDACALEIWSALTLGATLYLVSDEIKLGGGEALVNFYLEHDISHAFVPPALVPMVVDASQTIKGLSLQYILVGGDRLAPLRTSELSYQVVNQYGPTEATVMVTDHILNGEEAGTVPIGRPLRNTEVWVLDASGQVVAEGVEGEVYIGGVQLARGYWGRTAMTEEKFVAHPYRAGVRLYRSGDRGYWNREGELCYSGRQDEQVKLRGYRIELGEVEAALWSVEGVKGAAVVVVGEGADQRLIGYYSSDTDTENEGEGVEEAAVLARLSALLPGYLVPSRVIRIDELPLTLNGKVDRVVLVQDYEQQQESEQDNDTPIISPHNLVEEQVLAIWQSVLNRKNISINEDFFHLGGNSLHIMQLSNRYHKELGALISIEQLFSQPTIEAHAQLVDAASTQLYAPVQVVPEAADYAASDGQHRVWMLCQVPEVSRAYNMPGHVVLEGRQSADAFQEAIRMVISRHEILRTVFRQDAEGKLRQVVLSPDAFDFHLAYTEISDEAAVQQYLSEDAARVFDLARGPLVRAGLIAINDDKYIFYYNIHHIVSDGWSMNILEREVLTCYEAVQKNTPPSLVPLRIQYKDYTAWQQAQFATPAFEAHRHYWKERLAGPLPVLNWPSGRARPAVLTNNGFNLATLFDAALVKQLEGYCRQRNCSIFMGLTAVLRILLYRYSGQEDLVISTPIAGRDHIELEGQIGFYINTLALRTRLSADDTFGEVLDKVRTVTLEAYRHQSYPFDRLVKDLELRRDASRSPVADIALNLENHPKENKGEQPQDGGEEIIALGPVSSKIDLHFTFEPAGDALWLYLQYNVNVYEGWQMEGLLRHLRTLLRSCLQSPALSLSQHRYLDTEGFARLQKLSAPASEPYDTQATVLSLFAHQVTLQPQATALWSSEGELSYQELDEQSTRLAHELRRQGITSGSLVPVCLERNASLITSLLAILKSGAAYLPLDPQTPKERLAYLLEDSAATIVLTDTYYEELFSGLPVRRLCLDRDTFADTNSDDNLPIAAPHDLAYVIYTSGSTGQPKGVMIEHTSIVNLMGWHGGRYNVNHQSRSTCMAGVAFDACALEIWSALTQGAALYLISDELKLSGGEALVDFYLEHSISHALLPPALVPMVVEASQGVELISLRYVLAGGDRLAPLRTAELSYQVVNQYGPTEATVMVTDHILNGEEAGTVPIGRPLRNTEVWVLDASGQVVAEGVEGEVYIGGVQLARGYWGRTAMTEEKFVAHPYRAGARLYRSGDRGYWNREGELCYSGRQDEQVKLRGYRIELGEVEAALWSVEGVKGAAVVVVGEGADQRLIGYYSSSDDGDDNNEVEEAAVLARLSALLPGYLVPSRVIRIDELPLTLNGKVDRVALVQDYEQQQENEQDNDTPIISPKNPVEEALCQVYAQVLRRNAVGRNQNFFDLGGDSIKAILLINKLRPLGYTVQVGDVLRYPVVSDLAQKTEALSSGNNQPEENIEGDVPLTAIQRWFLDGPQEYKHHYNQSVLLYSAERINTEALKGALDALLRHHDALRMKFTQSGPGQWQQYNRSAENSACKLTVKDLADPEMIPAFCAQVQASLHLEQEPLLHAALMHLPDGDRLLLVVHHLVVDGVSWRILLEDLSTAYMQLRKGAPVILPPKTDSFRLWAERLHAYAKSDLLAGERSYWQEAGDLPSKAGGLPPDFPGGRHLLAESRTISFELPLAETLALQGAAHRAYNTQINELLLAALSLALGQVFGNGHATIQLEGHGREAALVHASADISRTVGWFTITYPVVIDRIAAVGTEAVLNTVISMKEKLRAVPGKGMGYGLLRYLHDDDEFKSAPAADITFNYLGDFGTAVSDSGGEEIFQYAREQRGAELHASAASETALGISGYTSSGVLSLSISYSPEQYRDATMHQLLDAYKASLSLMAEVLPQQEESQLTPSDLTFKNLSISEVRSLEAYGRLEDVYPLSPLQEGIYFHWLSEPGTTAYINQTAYRVKGALDLDLLRQSYALLVERHGILRTRFTHELGTRSLQAVYAGHPGHFRFVKSIGDTETFAEAFRERDRDEGFDLGTVSQMRLSVIRLNEDLHEFVWTHHHILMDGWCGSILINEFYTIYRSLVTGQTPVLPVTTPYVNYIRWIDNLQPNKGLDFWKQYLEDYDTAVSLPQKNRPATGSAYFLEQESFNLDAAETTALKTLCQTFAITESTFIQAAWGYLLSRYNNTGDVVFGTVVSGRPAELPGVETAVGLFINTIPVRVRYEGHTTVRELLQQVQQHAIEALPYHYLRLSDVQAQGALGNRLFDHIVVYENYWVQDSLAEGGEMPAATGEAATEELEFLPLGTIEQTNYDFNIMASVTAGSLSVRLSYNGEQYAKKWIEAVGAHFRHLLEMFLQQPDRPLSAINYLPVEEAGLLQQFNNTAVAYPAGRTMISLFCRQAAEKPTAPALTFRQETLSYGELDKCSNQLAHFLLKQGISPGQPVPVCLHRGPSLIVALLAVLKAGAAYVPIDPQYPPARIAYMLNDSRAKLVVSDSSLAELFTGSDARCLELDREGDEINSLPEQLPDSNVTPEQLAYIIYTSGSTGQPKGVMINHRSACNFIDWCLDEFRHDAVDVVFAVTSVCFDLSIFEIFYPLASGKRIRLVSEAATLQEELEKENRILLNVVPSLVRSLLENGADLSSVVTLNMAGEPITADIVSALDLDAIRVRNLYGPTEATTYSTFTQLHTGCPVTIGRPLANTEAWVLDRFLQPMPIGIRGEIFLGGVQLAEGYWNKPQLTEEKFIAHPLLKGERLYRTGDAGYWSEAGELYYGGRLDSQLKLRGYRIEPGEIEAVLQKLPGVRQAAVVAVGETDALQLAGFYTADEALNKAALLSGLQALLPQYMVPQRLEQLDELPLTVNGKTDRKALALLHEQWQQQHDEASADSHEQPQSIEEEVLCRVYSQVLQRTAVHRHQGFFDLGGDSIKAILLINRLRQQGYSVQVNEILRYPVVADLALKIKPLEAGRVVLEEERVEGEAGLTAIQQWFFQTSPQANKHHYNQSVLLRSAHPVDVHALEQALAAIVRHHDALRMVFEQLPDGAWRQYNRSSSVPAFELVVTELADVEAMGEFCTRIQSSFQLATGPLLKAALLRLPDGDRLLLAVHHLVVDGVSWRILLEDLSTAYMQTLTGAPVVLPVKSNSFRFWSAKLYEYVRSHRNRQHLDYWQQALHEAGNTRSRLPLDKLFGKHILRENKHLYFSLSANEIETAQGGQPYSLGTQVNDLLLAALGLALGTVFGQGKAVVQLEGHGREAAVVSEQIDIGRTVGWFTTLFPVVIDRTEPGNRQALSTALAGVKNVMAALPNKGFDYGLLRYLDEDVSVQWEKIQADITFNYLGDFGSSVSSSSGEQVFQYSSEFHGHEVDGYSEVESPLVINSYTLSGNLHIDLAYSPAQFHDATISNLQKQYRENLLQLIALVAGSAATTDEWNNDLPTRESNGRSEELFELSYNQQNYYNNGEFVHAFGSVDLYLHRFDPETFVSALNRVAANHAVLRTRFLKTDSGIRQFFAPSADYRPHLFFYEATDRAAAQAFLQELTGRPFDLLNGELLRCGIVRNYNDAYVQITFHHIITDGSSNNLLRDELLACYRQQQVAYEEQPYSSFIKAQQQYLQSAEGKEDIGYWTHKLAALGTKPRHSQPPTVLQRCVTDSDTHAAIVAFCKANDVLLSSFMLSVYYRLLASSAHADHPILLQVLTNGREGNIPGFTIGDSVGQFVSRLPLVLDRPADTPLHELVAYIQEEYLNGRANQQVPNLVIETEVARQQGIKLGERTGQFINLFDFRSLPCPREEYPQGCTVLTKVQVIPVAGCIFFEDAIVLEYYGYDGDDETQIVKTIQSMIQAGQQKEGLQQP